MYVFGGHSGLGYLNTLYKLHLSTLQWELVTPESSSPSPSPRDKTVSWFYDKKYGNQGLTSQFFYCYVMLLIWIDCGQMLVFLFIAYRFYTFGGYGMIDYSKDNVFLEEVRSFCQDETSDLVCIYTFLKSMNKIFDKRYIKFLCIGLQDIFNPSILLCGF